MAQSNLEKQVNWLENDVKQNKQLDAYPLWIRLVGVLSSMGTELEAAVIALRGDGNGNKGILQRVLAMEGIIKPMQSDIREIRTLVRVLMGLEHDPEALEHIERYSAEKHPGRRASDNKTSFDKVLGFFVDKVLPSLITSAIVGAIVFWIAVNQHLIAGG